MSKDSLRLCSTLAYLVSKEQDGKKLSLLDLLHPTERALPFPIQVSISDSKDRQMHDCSIDMSASVECHY